MEGEGPASAPADSFETAAGGIGLFVGIASLVFPRLLLRVYGADPNELNGTALMGWRLFAIRNLVVGGAAVAGDQKARDTVLLLQIPDLLLFAHSYKTRSIPRLTAVLAMLSASLVGTLGLLARSKR